MIQLINYFNLILISTIFIFSACSNPNPKSSINKEADTTLTYYLKGPVRYIAANARDIIADKWGFKYDHDFSCGYESIKVRDSIETHNKEVLSILNKRFGENWKNKFDEEVEAEYQLEQSILSCLDSFPTIIKITKLIDSNDKLNMYFNSKNENYYLITGTLIKNYQTPIGTAGYSSTVEAYKCFELKYNYHDDNVSVLNDSIIKIYP